MNSPQTIVSLFCSTVESHAAQTALHFKCDGAYRSVSWSDILQNARKLATGLVRLGLRPGDRVVQLSENRYEWIVCDLAIQLAQGVHVPLHATLTAQQVEFQIRDSGARIVFASTASQIEKLAFLPAESLRDLKLLAFDACAARVAGCEVQLMAELTADVGESNAAPSVDRALAYVSPASLATILYTSGTTGEPKGVMLTQGNLVSNTLATVEAFDQRPDDVRMSFLPYSHIFARTCDIYTWIASGCQLALAESRDTILDDCATIQPTVMNGVPYFFDKVRRHLIELGRADQTSSLRELLGGRMRFCCCGGAPLPDHVFDFFDHRKVPILQGYGLTETSPVISASTPTRYKRGCVGPPIPDVEVKIAADGEILTRGPHVMAGYWNNPAATNDVIRDGWFHTGDLGQLDEEGFLRITGRKKEMIVTSGGKNVAPLLLESLLTSDPLIEQALVVGDGRNYLAALIVPDTAKLNAEIAARQISVSEHRVLDEPQVVALFAAVIEQRLARLSHHEQVRKFALLDRSFSIESGELTPKLSLRRKVIEANWADRIEAMYGSS